MLARYGRREWIGIVLLSGGLGGTLLMIGAPGAAMAVWLLGAAGVLFFRDPPRSVPADVPARSLLSPADGRVQSIETHVDVDRRPVLVIRIFLSVFDVHLNRWPCDGIVIDADHRSGRHHDARSPQAARENEANLVRLRTSDGREIAVRQIAGLVARRIVCAAAPGDSIRRGERFGMIKFGSATELIVPEPAVEAVHVHAGARVRAGVTPLLTLAVATPDE